MAGQQIPLTLGNIVQQLPPPVLPQQFVPLPAALINSIPLWVRYNLANALLSNPHYEHQLYGPFNTFLTCIFPIDRFFSVHPQGLIRAPYQDENPLNVSTGSSGGQHRSRNVQGRE